MRTSLVLACFFASGVAGLAHEICWIRAASLLLGSSSYALGTVLAVFFLGLALGSWLVGNASRRMRRPLLVYAGLELGVALWASVSLWLLQALTPLYAAAYRASDGDAGTAFAARVAVLALVVLPPAALMGGTLPVLCRWFVAGSARIGRRVGGLYALNTAGAAIGCAGAGLVLVPALGMQATVWIAAGLNAACAVAAWVIARSGPILADAGQLGADEGPGTARTPASSEPPYEVDPRDRSGVTALFFLGGLVALGQEVLWARLIGLLIPSTTTTATVTLTVVLAGIVLGSALASLVADRMRSRARALGLLMALNGITALALMLLPPSAWRALHGRQLPTLFALLLPSAVLSGACFPLAVRMVVADARLASLRTGHMAAVNTLGGIVGSLLFAFVLLPRLGLQPSALTSTGLAVLGSGIAWLTLDRGAPRLQRWGWTAAAVVVWFVVPRLLPTRIPADHLAPRAALVAVREGREANLAVVQREDAKVLEINRWWQGQDAPTHQIVAAHLPMLLHPNPVRVLVVGVGAGQTPERFTWHATLQHLDAVDIEPAVFSVLAEHFASDWMRDPRVRLLREDGRSYLLHGSAKYDVISLEVGQISRPGVATFYTRELYEAACARLAPGGLVSQFVPLAFLTPQAMCSVVATFVDVFPQATLWYNTGELLLLGAPAPATGPPTDAAPSLPWRFDLERLQQRMQQPRVAEDLRFAHWGGAAARLRRPAALLGCFLCGPRQLAQLGDAAPLLHDDRPALEQAARQASEYQARELELVPLLRQLLTPLAAVPAARPLPPDTLAAAEQLRQSNLGDLVASALLRRLEPLKAAGDAAAVRLLLDQALAANPQSADGLRAAGYFLLESGDATAARARFGQAATLRPEDPLVIRGLGMALHRLGDLAGAQEQYQRSLALRENDAETHNNLGGAMAQRGDVAGALPHFQRALQLQPTYGDAARNLQRAQSVLAGERR